ncbi:phosphoribosylamine--glycine ligase [Gammaproteobacteria bacterium]|nr:phosphoribosylamine--glycine ligase [Gammaproteobacteria bacterium]
MKVMIIGSGGREHALAWKASQSHQVDKVYVVPGNAGTAIEPDLENVALDPMDFSALVEFAKTNDISLTIIGPEAPLVDGIVNYFQEQRLLCFGPSQGASQLEGSKAFSKDFLQRHNIPTADYQNFTEIEPAIAYLEKQNLPIVIKADGLAAGKGVIIAQTLDEAIETVKDMLSGNSFGDAGHRVVIEEFMQGEEASFIAIVDGKTALPFASSQDHKARDNGDLGPNTGGMGAYSPAPVVSPEIHDRIMQQVIIPTVKGMAAEGNTYVGFLYAGLMITPDGEPKVVEFNCRFGDPEAQPIMMRLQSDLVELCQVALKGELDKATIDFDARPAVGVVMAAGGYPNSYAKGKVISGLDSKQDKQNKDCKIFHAGTAESDGNIVTNGGRVLCATAVADTVTSAQQLAYAIVDQISWDEVYYRTDIAYRAIKREALQSN